MAEFIPMVLSWFTLLWISQSVVYTSLDATKRYDGFKTFKVTPENEHQIELLRGLRDMHSSYDWVTFWEEPNRPGLPVNLMVAPEDMNTLLDILRSHNINHQLHIDNVQHLIDRSRERDESYLRKRGGYNFEHYQTYEEILELMDNLITLYNSDDPNGLHLSAFKIAESYEGRNINALKMRVGSSDDKPIIWIMAGIHAREWIGPATVMYVIRELLRDWHHGKDDVVDILEAFDWYILPVFNVDGYVYSWTKDRLWRKTRSNVTSKDPPGKSKCVGVDPNRNWDYHWNEKGSGKAVCEENYAGTKPFSETEVQQVADFVTDLNKDNQVVAFLDIHSYGQMWMSPFGYIDDRPADYNKQVQLASQATDALSTVHGTQYAVGNIAEVIYKASGNSVDWAYGHLGIPFSYAIELPDTGIEGFLLVPERITGVGEEMYEAVKEMAKALLNLEDPETLYFH